MSDRPAPPDPPGASAASRGNLRRLRETFDRLSDLDEPARATELARLAATDPALALDVAGLLQAAGRTHTALDGPLLAFGDGDEAPAIPGFAIARRLGRGGSATVYLATQQRADFEREVALKVFDRVIDGESLRRFREEQRILARLEHPGIARLYDAGTTALGQPYLALELVTGESILEHCRSRALPLRARVEIFLPVLDAVAFAHAQGIVHRDLKPANILVSERGEPKLLDFGIAKLLAEPGAEEETRTLRRAMTPAYASPEQVSGGRITEPSDIYSLGVVLYELLAGTLPYRLENRELATIERAIREQDPEPPSSAHARATATTSTSSAERLEAVRWRRSLRGDLDAVLLKALRKEPRARYASVRELAEDLRRTLAGLPVSARRGDWSYRAQRVLRRSGRWIAGAVAIGLIAVAAIRIPWTGRPAPERAEIASFLASNGGQGEARSLLHAGAEKLAAFDAPAAQASFLRATEVEPTNALAWDGLSRSAALLGEPGASAAAADKAAKLSPSLEADERTRMEARALAAGGSWDRAIAALEALYARLPERTDVGLDLVNTLLLAGRTDDANSTLGRLSQLRLAHGAAASDPRIDLLDAQVALRLGEAQRALASAMRVQKRAAELVLPALAVRADRLRAEALYVLDRRDDARNELRALIPRAEALGLRCEAAATRLALGRLLLRMGAGDEAEAALTRALADLHTQGDLPGEIQARNELAIARGMHGQLPDGLHLSDEALAAAQQLGDRWIVGSSLMMRAVLLNWANDEAAGQALVEPMLQALRASGNRQGLAGTLVNLAIHSVDELEFDRAASYIEEAEALESRIASKLATSKIHMVRGALEAARGNVELARQSYQAALASARAANVPLEVGNDLNRLAWLERFADRPDDAERWANEAIATLHSAGNERMAAETGLVLAWVDGRRHRRPEALARLEEIRRSIAAGSGVSEFNLITTEAAVYEMLGDLRRAAEAHRKAIRMAEEWKLPTLRLNEQVGLARTLLALGDRESFDRLTGDLLPELQRRGMRSAESELRGLLATGSR